MERNRLRYLVAVALAAAALPAGAQVPTAPLPDTSKWTCESCPFFVGYESDASAGAAYAQGANASFGRYTGIDAEEVHVEAGASGQWRSAGGTKAEYVLEDLGLDSRSGRIAFGREGTFDVALSYDGLPYRVYDTTRTPYRGFEALTLPSNWVRAGTTRGMSALNASLLDRDIGTERKTYGLAARWLPGRSWTVFADYQRQEKDGYEVIYGSFLTQAVELPEPVEYVTDTVELGTEWSGSRASARLAYTGSFFRNLNLGLSFQNPYTPLFPAAGTGRLALAPDSQAQAIALSGNVMLGVADAVVSYSASIGELTQDDALLPVSTASGATPRATLDGKVDIASYGLALSLRPLSKLSVRANARWSERDDRTAPLSVNYIITDTVAGGTDVTPRYDYDRARFDGTAEYALLRWLRVGGGVQHDTIERTESEVGKTVESGSWLRLRLAPAGALGLTLKAGQLHREASDFNVGLRDPDENPLLRKYNLANRDRNFAEAIGSIGLTDRITFTLNGRLTDDAYRRSWLGLTDGGSRNLAGNLSIAASDTLSVYGDVGYQRQTYRMLGQGRPAGAAWSADGQDDFLNAGVGARWQPAEKWNVTADVVYAEGSGDVALTVSGVPTPYPEIETRLGSVRLGVQYRLSDALTLGARYRYESFDQNDWALDGVGPATVPQLLSLGAEALTHDVSLVSFTFTYRFGTAAAPAAKAE